jgi:hypothetical protein
MNTTVRLFLFGYVPTLLVAGAYWPIVYLASDKNGAVTGESLMANPALSIYQPIVLPILAGIAMATFRANAVAGIEKPWRVAFWGTLALFALAAFTLIKGDSSQALRNRVVEPIEWKLPATQKQFRNLEAALLAAKATGQKSLCPDLVQAGTTDTTQCYLAKRRELQLNDIRLFADLGPASWWQRVMSIQAGLFAAGVFAAFFIYHTRGPKHPKVAEGILVCLALFALWIPFRIYSDWRANFQSFSEIHNNSALIFLSPLILLSLLWTYLRILDLSFTSIFGITAGALAILTGALVKFAQSPLEFISRALAAAEFEVFAVVEFAFMCLLLTVAWHTLRPSSK